MVDDCHQPTVARRRFRRHVPGRREFPASADPTIDLVRVLEQCASGCPANGGIPGLVYRSQDFSSAYTGSYLWKLSLSRTSGARSWKVGYQHTLMTDDRTWFTNSENLTYRLNNGVPNQLIESISPWVNNTRVGWDAFFAQQQWTHRRMTLQGAVRFDRSASWFPRQQEGPSTFLPSAIVIPETSGVDSYKDITPRGAVAYDVFGNGKTAVKFQLGRYLEGAGTLGNYANSNPTLRMPQTTSVMGTAGVTRGWIDGNANFVPDCNLRNPAEQDLRGVGGDVCGAVSDQKFGTDTLVNDFAHEILNGWGVYGRRIGILRCRSRSRSSRILRLKCPLSTGRLTVSSSSTTRRWLRPISRPTASRRLETLISRTEAATP